jgi:flagellin
VNFSPPAVYTRTEDGSTTSAITLDVPSATFSGTQILAPWDGNSLGGSSNASDSSLTQSTAAEFGVVARQALQELAEMRAKNGAEQSGLHFARDLLQTNEVNLTSANSRILDADIAAESLHLARSNILVQGATAMLAQANQSAQSLLKLLL